MAAVFFADHCVPTVVVDDLRQAGYEVLVLKDHLPTASPDEVVIDEAGRLEAVSPDPTTFQNATISTSGSFLPYCS